jgi:hypothetical protein
VSFRSVGTDSSYWHLQQFVNIGRIYFAILVLTSRRRVSRPHTSMASSTRSFCIYLGGSTDCIWHHISAVSLPTQITVRGDCELDEKRDSRRALISPLERQSSRLHLFHRCCVCGSHVDACNVPGPTAVETCAVAIDNVVVAIGSSRFAAAAPVKLERRTWSTPRNGRIEPI